MRKILLSFLIFPAIFTATAQTTWYDPMAADKCVIQNQAFVGEINGYSRLPKRAHDHVRESVWDLSQHSSGLAIYFYTDSPNIEVNYTTIKKSYAMNHMPATGVSGVDLYRIDNDGNWAYCAAKYSFGEEVSYKYSDMDLSSMSHEKGYEYRLYLPLYNGVTEMKIGVDEGSRFEFITTSEAKPIVLYGTSIAQGGCVSRPAMMWSTIVQRSIGVPLVNLGFSGNGRLEKEVLDFIAEIDAELYILDCVPNLVRHSEQEVYQLTIDAVQQLRAQRNTPILLVEHTGFSDETVNQKNRDDIKNSNAANRRAYEQLCENGVDNLYYISKVDMALSQDATVDGTHLTDYGMMQQAEAMEKIIREILKMPRNKRKINAMKR